MTDIVRLGIAIDATQAVNAKRALDDFTTSGKSAAAAAANLQKQTAPAANGANAIAKSTAAASAGARGLSFDAKNLSYQLVDVTQGLLSGQPAFQIFAQQAGQIGQVIATSPKGLGGLLKELGGAFVGILTPARLAGAGVAAAGVAVYAAYQNWKTFTLQLDDTARAAGTSTRSLSALQAAASFKGISGDDFTKGVENFSRNLYDAKNNVGSLADLFKANNLQVGNFDDAMSKAANLIRNAKDDQQRLVLLQQMGLPATMQWVRLLSGGADGLKAAKDAAAEFAANDNMIQKARQFDETWNKTWANFGINARSAFQTALQGGSGFFAKMEGLAQKVGSSEFWKVFLPNNADQIAKGMGITPLNAFDQRFAGSSNNPAANNTALQDDLTRRAAAIRGQTTQDPNALQTEIANYQRYVGLLGEQASISQVIASVDKQIQAYNLTPGAIALTDRQVSKLKELAAERALGITQIKAQADSYRVEAATIGMSVGDATAYASAQNAINDARRAGRDLTPDNIAQIKKEASALGDAARQADLMSFAYNGLVQGPLQTFTSAIAQGSSAFDALKKAGQSALSSIASKLADMAAQNLWKSAFGGSSGLGGIISSLFGGGSAAGSVGVVGAAGGMVVPTFAASGGYISGPGTSTSDSIPARLSNGEFVVNARSTSANRGLLEAINSRGFANGGIVDSRSGFSVRSSAGITAANSNTGSSSPVPVNINVNVTGAKGNQEIQEMVQAGVRQGLGQFVTSPQFTQHVAVANKKASDRMVRG